MLVVDSFLDLETVWRRWLPQSCLLKSAILSIEQRSQQYIIVSGIWEHFVRSNQGSLKFSTYYFLVVAWIAWATSTIDNTWSWRTLTLLQVVPAAIQLIFIYWVPESPRWLMAKERYEEAETMLAKYHANGDKNNSTVAFEYREIKETLRLEFESKKSSSYLDFMKTRGNRYRLALLVSLGVISQYSGNALFSNYLNRILAGAGITREDQTIPVSRINSFLI